MFGLSLPSSFWNGRLAGEPLNWLIVGVVASIWLMLFHVIMQGFSAMQGRPAFGSGPGTISMNEPVAAAFSQPSVMAQDRGPGALGAFIGGATPIWTDSYESKYAEDGWVANP